MTDVERKIQLTRFIREENAMNRMKLKKREGILHGKGTWQYDQDDLPLVHDGYFREAEFDMSRPEAKPPASTLELRVLLAILLFGAVVYMDRTGTVFQGEPAAQVIARQISVSSEEKLMDFINMFSYLANSELPWGK